MSLAYDRAVNEEQIRRLRIEVNDRLVPHSVRTDLYPKCIVFRLPVESSRANGGTDISIVVPYTACASSAVTNSPDQRSLGLALISISVLPEIPALKVVHHPSRFERIKRRVRFWQSDPLIENFPLPYFDGYSYAIANQDVANAVQHRQVVSALEHYIRYGYAESREFKLATSGEPNEGTLQELLRPQFDGLAYLRENRDVAEALRRQQIESALQHYTVYGINEGRGFPRADHGKAIIGNLHELIEADLQLRLTAAAEAMRADLESRFAADRDLVRARLNIVERHVGSLGNNRDSPSSTATASAAKRPASAMTFDQKLDAAAFAKVMSYAEDASCEQALELLRRKLKTHLWLTTCFDAPNFERGFSLIAALCKQGYAETPKIVFDNGLTPSQRTALFEVDHVFVVQFNRKRHDHEDWLFDTRNRLIALLVMEHMCSVASAGENVVWMDVDLQPVPEIAPINAEVEREGSYFSIFDRGDGRSVSNVSIMSEACCKRLCASRNELHARSVDILLMGFQKHHRHELIFREAFRAAQDPHTVLDTRSRTPASTGWEQNTDDLAAQRKRIVTAPQRDDSVELDEMRKLFGAAGHSLARAIVSILAARYGGNVKPAVQCGARDTVSCEHRQRGGEAPKADSDLDSAEAGARNIPNSHEAAFIDFDGILYPGNRKDEAVILGNGPSLRGFDFSRLERFDVFGMNAAYRYWYEVGWFPQYYSCLDNVVGRSHIDAIRELLERSESLGIRAFLLRGELIRALGEAGMRPGVFDFDLLKPGFEVWKTGRVTTGSHTAAWAYILGYRKIYLLGVDCNYVEMLPNAKQRGGTVLEITEAAPNPNYFFDAYQQPGDRYNIPNPIKDLHLRSWREIAAKLERKALVLNANPASRIDAFRVVTFDDVEKGVDLTNSQG